MNSLPIDQAVSIATGESVRETSRRSFNSIDLIEVDDDPESEVSLRS